MLKILRIRFTILNYGPGGGAGRLGGPDRERLPEEIRKALKAGFGTVRVARCLL
jgi:hypothetical protein